MPNINIHILALEKIKGLKLQDDRNLHPHMLQLKDFMQREKEWLNFRTLKLVWSEINDNNIEDKKEYRIEVSGA